MNRTKICPYTILKISQCRHLTKGKITSEISDCTSICTDNGIFSLDNVHYLDKKIHSPLESFVPVFKLKKRVSIR
jgi:hypothetical protein